MNISDREALIRERIQEIAEDVFPDNTDVTWEILAISHEGAYSLVESKPDPDTVGYPAFKFVVSFGSIAPGSTNAAGVYCLQDGKWTLLCSDPRDSDEWRKLFTG